MRAMWKGSIAFGLVNVPIKLYAATEDHDVRFHQVHAADGGRVRMVRTCSVDGKPIDVKEIAKAYETDSGQVVVMEDADFEGLPVPGVKEIEVLEFVPSDQVDPVLLDRSYYLEPEPRALKPYVLLREALEQTDRTAVVRVVLRTKTQLGALRVRGDVLVLQTLLWPDEVREADFDVLLGETEVRPQELAMASSLIDSLSADFDPGQFRDEYREALLAVIDRKLAGGQGIAAPVAAGGGDQGEGIVVDLMSALRESVRRSQESRAQEEAAEPAVATAKKRAATGGSTAKGRAGKQPVARPSRGRATAAASEKAASAEKKGAPATRSSRLPA